MDPSQTTIPPARLDEFMVIDSAIRRLLDENAAGAVEAAEQRLAEVRASLAAAGGNGLSVDSAREATATRLSDLGAALVAAGDVQRGWETLRAALNMQPHARHIVHNAIVGLLVSGNMRGDNYRAIQGLVSGLMGKVDWAHLYEPVLWMPTFLNVQFVHGKCNLKCRMCIGINSSDHPNKLSWLSPDDFRKSLLAAPTMQGLTLSSADSDPLLHPKFDEILGIARELNVTLNMFTNGLPLSEKRCERIVDSQIVSMINFSIDAATSETYERIRGGDFERLRRNIEMLLRVRSNAGRPLPLISMSFVAMADNIHELPDFVDMANKFDADRVYVEDLIGWIENAGGNLSVDHNESWQEYVAEAQKRASTARATLVLPVKMRSQSPKQQQSPEAEAKQLPCCGWLNGVWVRADGNMNPCCLVGRVTDMGNIYDGPLHENPKFNRVKKLLAEGKVFQACENQRNCEYVQQQYASKTPLSIISPEELGEARVPDNGQAVNGDETTVSLPVLTSNPAA